MYKEMSYSLYSSFCTIRISALRKVGPTWRCEHHPSVCAPVKCWAAGSLTRAQSTAEQWECAALLWPAQPEPLSSSTMPPSTWMDFVETSGSTCSFYAPSWRVSLVGTRCPGCVFSGDCKVEGKRSSRTTTMWRAATSLSRSTWDSQEESTICLYFAREKDPSMRKQREKRW